MSLADTHTVKPLKMNAALFKSFILGGFECSTHRRRDGTRLDLIHSTRHDVFARADYEHLQRHGIATARDGFRWHLIEATSGSYDFSSAIPMLEAARVTGMQVIWDLWHYGWPDHLDIFSAAFVDHFAAFAREAAKYLSDYDDRPFVSPVNEISFFSWAGAEAGFFNPFAQHRGHEMKRQLVRATIAAVAAMREVNPEVRFCQIDPIINVVPRSLDQDDVRHAEDYRCSQFEAWDMILGRVHPELGGAEHCIDVIGVNYYIHNQFVWEQGLVVPSDPRYRHVSTMLDETYRRYQRPIFVAETGIEDESRPAWLRYIFREVLMAMTAGVPVEGICLYPIVNHPGWDDDRHCHNGLFDYADDSGRRDVYRPLAEEVSRQIANVAALLSGEKVLTDLGGMETDALDWAAHAMVEKTEVAR